MIVRVTALGLIFAALIALAALGSGLFQPSSTLPAARSDRPRVVATFSILQDLAANVGGEEVEIVSLLGPDADVHTFEPTPASSRALRDAHLIVEIGLGYESWLDTVYQGSGSTTRRVVVTDGLEPLHADEHEHIDEEEVEGEHGEDGDEGHGELDPHMWHDVARVVQMTNLMRDALIEVDAPRADTYRANAAAFVAQLEALDSWVVESVARIPEPRRKIVTPHNTFAYFADRYGFQVAGTALASASTEAQPSAGHVASLVEEIRREGVPAIFPENLGNQGLMQRLAGEAGVALGPPLFSDALGSPGSEADTYLKLMRHNVTALVDNLGAN